MRVIKDIDRCMAVVFLAYALVHKIKPLIVTQVLWFIVDAVIVLGIFLYN